MIFLAIPATSNGLTVYLDQNHEEFIQYVPNEENPKILFGVRRFAQAATAYALTSPLEDFAEAFAYFFEGGERRELLRQRAPQAHAFMELEFPRR